MGQINPESKLLNWVTRSAALTRLLARLLTSLVGKWMIRWVYFPCFSLFWTTVYYRIYSPHLVSKANHLGLDLEASEDRSLNGCLVRNIVSGSAAEKDKRVKEGDFVIAVNNESLKGATTAQAKAILRRASLLGGRREKGLGFSWLRMLGS